jgi:hypothetical protein
VLGDVAVDVAQLADPGLVYASDGDAEAAAATRASVLAGLADEGVPLLVAHFRGAGRVTREGDGFAWNPL